MKFSRNVREAYTLFNDAGELHVHSDWAAASWSQHFILQVESVNTIIQSCIVRNIVKRKISHAFLFSAARLPCWPIGLGQIAPNTFLSLCIFISSALAAGLKDHGLI